MNKSTISAIVTMAKRGTYHEKKSAVRILKKLCKKHNLVFEELMEEEKLKDFKFEFDGKIPQIIVFQIFFMIINNLEATYNKYYLFVKTTKEKYIEFENALEIYQRLYKKERTKMSIRHQKEKKIFPDAFIQRHRLFPEMTKEEKEKQDRKSKAKKITEEELKDLWKVANEMEEDAMLYKQLKK